jgi:flagellar protein FliS
MENAIMSASKEEMTLMLYEGALKFCNHSIVAVERKEYERANELIIRVQDIVREFQVTLDHQFEISGYMNSLYDYIYRRLVEANFQKDVEILGEVRDLLRDFRDTWKEAMKLAKQQVPA